MSRFCSLIFFTVSCMSVGVFTPRPAHARIGDVVGTVTLLNGSGARVSITRFAFDEVLGRYHVHGGLNSGAGDIMKFDRTGQLLRSGRLTENEFGNSAARGFVVQDDNVWLTLNNFSTITRWNLGIDQDGDLTIANGGTTSLAGFLAPLQFVTSFDRAPDGTFWLSIQRTDSGTSGDFIHVDANFATELGRFDFPAMDDKYAGGLGLGVFDGIRVEQFTGDLIVGAGFTNYIDKETSTLRGRFSTFPRPLRFSASGNGVLHVLDSSTLDIVQHSIEDSAAPQVTDIVLNQEGVIWASCTNGPLIPELFDFKILVDWGDGGPGTDALQGVRVLAGFGGIRTVDATGITVQYDLGPNASRLVSENADNQVILDIQLVNSNDQISPLVKDFALNLFFYLGDNLFCEPCSEFDLTQQGNSIRWFAFTAIPPAPIEFSIPPVPAFFPIIGGSDLKFVLQATGKGLIDSLEPGEYGATVRASFAIATSEIRGDGTEVALPILTPQGIEYRGGKISLQVTGVLKRDVPWTLAVPPLANIAAVFGGARLVKWLDEWAKLFGEIRVDGGGSAILTINPATGATSFSGEFPLGVALRMGAQVKIPSMFWARAFAEGRFQPTFQSVGPDFSPAFKDVQFSLLIVAHINAWMVNLQYEKALVLKYDSATGTYTFNRSFDVPVEGAREPPDWGYTFGRWPLDPEAPADPLPRIVTPNPIAAAARMAGGVSTNTEIELISGIGSDAAPFLAMGEGGNMMAVWVSEAAGLPPTQASDIYYSFFNGIEFSPPAPISTDTHADFSPLVAYHNSGVWVAFWERVVDANLATTGDPLADLSEVIIRLVPAYSVYEPSVNTWSPVQMLDTAGTNVRLKLATGPGFDITALWINNPDGEILGEPLPFSSGDPIRRDSLMYARFFNGAFETPADSGLDRIIDYDAADNGVEARIAFTTIGSATGGLAIDPLRGNIAFRVHRRTHGGISPAFFSYGFQQNGFDFAPRIRVMKDGTWRAAWMKWSADTPGRFSIVVSDDLQNIATNARTLIVDDSFRDAAALNPSNENKWFESDWNEMQLGETADGDLFVIYPDYANNNPDMRIIFDDPTGMPSGAGGLLGDSAADIFHQTQTAVFGTALMSAFKLGVTREIIQMDIGGGEMLDFIEVTEEPTGSLVIIAHRVTRDLFPGEVRMIGGLPRGGREVMLTTTVSNIGDLSVTDPTVSIFARNVGPFPIDGDGIFQPIPDTPPRSSPAKADPILVAGNIPVVAGMMRGFSEASVEVAWTLPEDAIYELFAVVDPNNTIAEDNEGNNTGGGKLLIEPQSNAARNWTELR